MPRQRPYLRGGSRNGTAGRRRRGSHGGPKTGSQILGEYLLNTRGVFAEYWRSICEILRGPLSNTRRVFAKYSRSICEILAEYLLNTPPTPVKYSPSIC